MHILNVCAFWRDTHGIASCGVSRKYLSAAICLRDLDDPPTEAGDGDLERE